VIPWLWLYRRPAEHPRLTAEERKLAAAEAEATDVALPSEGRWRYILHRRETWLLMIGRMITDPVWYFYLFWFPKYLTDARHLTLFELGRIAWIVYLAADLGCILGGAFSGFLIKRGCCPARSRLLVMGVAFLLPISPLINFAASPLMAVCIAAIVAFAHLSWQTSLSALIVDLYPKPLVGTVFGLVSAGSGLGGLISTNLVGRAVTYYSYAPLFIAMGFLHPLAYILITCFRKKEP
jgi:ACS family hexuronate transporter-like MFS transporter